jgi:hypothetical protein
MNQNVKNAREKIMEYVNALPPDGQSVLLFSNCHKKVKDIETKHLELDDIIFRIIKLSEDFYSFNPTTDLLETVARKNRSAIDIWRHYKSIDPEAEIFPVMEALYRLRLKLCGRYCSTVKRITFDRNEAYHGYLETPTRLICREFGGISFYQWRNLTK